MYADNATSTEFNPRTQQIETVEGLEAIIAKGKHFVEMIEEVHSLTVSQPVVAGNYFSVAALMEVTLKGMGKMQMDEIAVYKLNNYGLEIHRLKGS